MSVKFTKSLTTYLLKARSGQAILAFDNLADALEAKAMREEVYRTTLTLVEQTITEKEIEA